MNVRTKRVYDPPDPSDGVRVLVDRLWPRGLKKEAAAVDVWAKELAPSHELRKWFDHDDEKFDEFERRYLREIENVREEVDRMVASVTGGTVTLVYGAKNTEHNNAVVLQAWMQRHY